MMKGPRSMYDGPCNCESGQDNRVEDVVGRAQPDTAGRQEQKSIRLRFSELRGAAGTCHSDAMAGTGRLLCRSETTGL